jgi:hypothetical protein
MSVRKTIGEWPVLWFAQRVSEKDLGSGQTNEEWEALAKQTKKWGGGAS